MHPEVTPLFGMIIADDEEIIRDGLMTIPWEKYGIEVLGLAADGDEAMQLVRETRPDILLTDIRMPGLDGIEITRLVRQECPDTVVILLTAHHDFEYAHSAIQLGVSQFILKPASGREILDAVSKAAEALRQRMEREEREDQLKRMIREYEMLLKKQILPDKPALSESVRKAIEYIENHYMEELSIPAVARHVHLNPVYLSRVVKKETGETILEILTRIRMQRAYDLLSDPDLKMYEIAEKVGIPDAKYFGQLFKKYYGMTPSSLRQEIQETKRMAEGEEA